jgi:hypothetical protein
MGKTYNISDNRPLVLYDADRQKAIGIFRSQSLATKYLFPGGTKRFSVNHALLKKIRIKNSDLKTTIAVRYANPEQLLLLGENEVYMLDESLKKFDRFLLNGFHGSREEFYREHVIEKYGKKIS